MRISPDDLVFWKYGFVKINLTIAITWAIIIFLAVASFFLTRHLKSQIVVSKGQLLFEIILIQIKNQIREIGLEYPDRYLGFIGTLFLFIATSNLLIIIPGYEPPTGSISTTLALALCVFFAVPVFAISQYGILNYLKTYIEPFWIMFPFHIISELTRTLALAVRLFGNMMSGTLIVSILVSITPLLFPIVMTILGLLTGMVQAYIFSVLATVYIAAASKTERKKKNKSN